MKKRYSRPNNQTAKAKFDPTETLTKPIDMYSLLEYGAHFGHKTSEWNPKALPYIFGKKAGIHVINVEQTIAAWKQIRPVIVELAKNGGTFLFVGTKNQIQPVVKTQAERCGSFYINSKWCAGTLTNMQTVRISIEKMKTLDRKLKAIEEGKFKSTKKETLMMTRAAAKLHRYFDGIAEMKKAPSLVIALEPLRDPLAIFEARRLQVPTLALSDTNMNPGAVTMAIPCNDDAVGVVQLFFCAIADAVIEGRMLYSKLVQEQADALIHEEEQMKALMEAAEQNDQVNGNP